MEEVEAGDGSWKGVRDGGAGERGKSGRKSHGFGEKVGRCVVHMNQKAPDPVPLSEVKLVAGRLVFG